MATGYMMRGVSAEKRNLRMCCVMAGGRGCDTGYLIGIEVSESDKGYHV